MDPRERGAPAADPVARGVEVGYRVVEEYMRHGQSAARAWAPYASTEAGGGAPAPDEMQQRMSAMFRQAADLAMMWMDMAGMGLAGGVGPSGAPSPFAAPGAWVAPPPPVSVGPFPMGDAHAPPAPHAPTSAPPAGPSQAPARTSQPRPVPRPAASTSSSADQTTFVVDIESAQRAKVIIDLRPRSAGLALRVHDLRAPDPALPRISGVEITGSPDDELVEVRIRVPSDLPPGVYSGVILDEATSLPRGTLSVRIGSP